MVELVRACWALGSRPSLAGLRLRKWAHMLGFGGHFSAKSRRYSTTLGTLRRARAAYAIRRRRGESLPLDALGAAEDDQAVIVVATSSYIGSGYQSTKDVERFLTGIGNDKLRGTWTDPTLGRVLLADWYVLWRRATLELRPNTEARDERLFRLHILPRFGSMSLVAITQYEVRAWVTQASRQGLAASTVRRAYQLLGKVMAAAVDAGMIAQNPLSSGAAAEDRASGDALSYPG